VQDYVAVNGDYCTVSGNYCVVNGDKCTVSGNNCVVNGDKCKVTGENCIRPGEGNVDGIHQVNGGTTTITMGSHGAIRPRPEIAAAVNVMREKKRWEDKEEEFVECPTEAQTKEHDKTLPEKDDEDAARCVVCLERAPSCAVVPCMQSKRCYD
jgi:hypothetical protein